MNTQIPLADERTMANAIRALTMDAVQAAGSGHPGMPMGMADVATVLFNRFMKIDPQAPGWIDRDRFVLSAGHGSMLLYAVHHLLGYDDMEMDQLRAFRQLGSTTPGHPEYGHTKGVEMTTGPLGQGIATAVGMALGERMGAAHFGDLIDHFTYVLAGDGCLMEGISHEAIDFAGHMELGRLIVLWDDNRITIDGATDLATSTDQEARFAAAGWQVLGIDGHDTDQIAAAIEEARTDPRPSLIACRTVIGYGAPSKQGSHAVHGAPLGDAEITAARVHLGWPHAPFDIPQDVYSAWGRIAARGAKTRIEWEARLANSPERDALNAAMSHDCRPLHADMATYKQQLCAQAPKVATRKASEMALAVAVPAVPFCVGGSADLTGSNLTHTAAMQTVTKDDYTGSYIHYGIREHGMAAIMNGLSLHGLTRPYGGTFLAFADYCRPATRLSALMGQPVTYVMTHDSIGLGEDGPTHQPIEHLASLRAMPNLDVIRPADAVETAEAWELALASTTTPTVLALSRQEVPCYRTTYGTENLTARGAYLLHTPSGPRDVTLIATGTEVEIAMTAMELLAADGISAAVVSAPCFERFAAQPPAAREAVLGTPARIGIEAAIRQGWDLMLRPTDGFIGMTGFGASAPAPSLYSHFGITAQAVVEKSKNMI
ncbi:MAG: transketolase [Sediminimonas qiaohouensis]|uniref:Transketolase n=1 Tax=Sediminimonas qiaohouensis TaxID=552061 RepID=A0A7C9LP59_9RHOB|nr:transketolase [Sediminimonas qiaohouensis]MTJ05202.1 transketolase [Sediminimonas qiaohouensis]